MNHLIQHLGPLDGSHCFYLPTPPQLTTKVNGGYVAKTDEINIDEIITLNGNHWRKILTIIAKISAPDDDWRPYLTRLLTQNELIRFNATQLHPGATHHFVCGQQSAHSLGLAPLTMPQTFMHHSENSRHIYRLPYLDYRQCPNHLIAQIRQNIRDEKRK